MTSVPGQGTELFEQVVAASGLNRVVAPFTISRLLIRANVQASSLTREELARALPEIEAGLAVYLRGEELDRAVRAVRALT